MPQTPDSSSFTRFTRLSAGSIKTTKTPTAASYVPTLTVTTSIIGSIAKASAVSASASPSTTVKKNPTKGGKN